MRVLPTGWSEAKLKDVLRHVLDLRGRTPKKLGMSWGGGDIPALSAVNVRQGSIDLSRTSHYGSRELYKRWMTGGDPERGDIAFTTEAPLGNVAQIPDQRLYILSQRVVLLKPRQGLDSTFLAHQLRSPDFRDSLRANATGTTATGIRASRLVELPVRIAPLGEQKRIAGKLDALLARVDACRQRLDRVPTILKRFRQAMLAAATSGELTVEWREERGRTTDHWESTTVSSVLDGKPRNGYSPKAVDGPTPVKSLALTATTSGRFRREHFKYIGEEVPSDSHLWLVPGDILIQRANTLEYVGVSAVFDGPPASFIYPDLMMKCRANERVLPKYLHYILSSEPVRAFFRQNATGTAGNMPKINQQTVLDAPANVPPLDEQREIVRRAEEAFEFVDSLEKRIESLRVRLALLTPALLRKAFRGELVSQDPNEKPASVMLEPLRAQNAAAEGEKAPPPSRRASSRSKPAARPKRAAAKTRRAS